MNNNDPKNDQAFQKFMGLVMAGAAAQPTADEVKEQALARYEESVRTSLEAAGRQLLADLGEVPIDPCDVANVLTAQSVKTNTQLQLASQEGCELGASKAGDDDTISAELNSVGEVLTSALMTSILMSMEPNYRSDLVRDEKRCEMLEGQMSLMADIMIGRSIILSSILMTSDKASLEHGERIVGCLDALAGLEKALNLSLNEKVLHTCRANFNQLREIIMTACHEMIMSTKPQMSMADVKEMIDKEDPNKKLMVHPQSVRQIREMISELQRMSGIKCPVEPLGEEITVKQLRDYQVKMSAYMAEAMPILTEEQKQELHKKIGPVSGQK